MVTTEGSASAKWTTEASAEVLAEGTFGRLLILSDLKKDGDWEVPGGSQETKWSLSHRAPTAKAL